MGKAGADLLTPTLTSACFQDSLEEGSVTETWPLHIRLEEEEERAGPGPGRAQ